MNVWLIPSSLCTTTASVSKPHHLHHLPIIPTKLTLHNTLLATTLSFGFLFTSLPSPSSAIPTPHSPSSETCRDADSSDVTVPTNAPEVVTNEGLVQEAWQIVNDDFLDTGRHRWSHDTWQVLTSIFKPPHQNLHLFFIIDYFIYEFLSCGLFG